MEFFVVSSNFGYNSDNIMEIQAIHGYRIFEHGIGIGMGFRIGFKPIAM